jgi:hypothetical protein
MMQIAKWMDVPIRSDEITVQDVQHHANIILVTAYIPDRFRHLAIFRLLSPEGLVARGFHPAIVSYSIMDDGTCAKALHLPSEINFLASLKFIRGVIFCTTG